MPLHIIIGINTIEGGKHMKNRPKKLLLISALERTWRIFKRRRNLPNEVLRIFLGFA